MPALAWEMALVPVVCLWVVSAQGVGITPWVAFLSAGVLGFLVFRRLVLGVRVGAPFLWLAGFALWVLLEALAQPVPWSEGAHFFACTVLALALALVAAHPWGRRWLRWATVAAGLTAAFWLVAEKLLVGGRPGGPFLNPNLAASLVVLALAFVLTQTSGTLRWVAALSLLAGVGASGSRAAALALLVLALVLACYRLPSQAWVVGLLALGGLAFFLWRLATDPDPLRYERLRIWRTAWHVAMAYAPWGTGPGGFADAVLAFNFPREGEFARFARIPHLAENDALQALASLGLPGFFLATGLLTSLGRRAWPRGPRELAPLAVVATFSAVHTQLPWPVGAWLAVAPGLFAGRRLLRLSPLLAGFFLWPFVVLVPAALAWPRLWPEDAWEKARQEVLGALRPAASQESLAQALVRAEELVHLAPRRSLGWRLRGLAQFNLGQRLGDGPLVAEAAASFRRARELNPKDVWAFYGEAQSFLTLGQVERARAAATGALQVEPHCLRCWLTLAQAQLFAGDLEAASRSWQKARQLHPWARRLLLVTPYERELAAWDEPLARTLEASLRVPP